VISTGGVVLTVSLNTGLAAPTAPATVGHVLVATFGFLAGY